MILMIHMLNCVCPDVAKDMNIKVFNLMSRTNETRRCRLDEVFLMIINVGIVIHAGVNAKSCLIKIIVIVNLFGILAYVNVNLISRVMLENIYIMQIVSVEKGLLIINVGM